MRKLTILSLVIALGVLLCACSNIAGPALSGETEVVVTEAPQLHTVAPVSDETELEWCPVEDCKLTFNDSDGVAVLNEKDIEKFALSGTGDSARMIFALSADAKAMMSAAQSTESFVVVLEGEQLGTAYFSDTQEELVLSGIGYEDLCAAASRIRGFE